MTKRQENTVKVMAEISGFSLEEILSSSRIYPLTFCRFILYEVFHQEGLRVGQIAKIFNRDHASVNYGIGKIRDTLGSQSYKDIKLLYADFVNQLAKMTDYTDEPSVENLNN